MTLHMFSRLCGLACLLWLSVVPLAAADLPDKATLRTWIEEMKSARRGPFLRIRWFCQDGTILPPKGSCREHGGGIQHGEWNARTKQLRAGGYHIANILGDVKLQDFTKQPEYASIYKQILLEQFLLAFDDGWIFRKAHFYRGALQAEDETEGARLLFLSLLAQPEWTSRRFLPLRVGLRLLPHGQETSLIATVRQQSAALSRKDPKFMTIRNKIHVKPDPTDAVRVRDYAAKVREPALKAEFDQLAANIDKVYASQAMPQTLNDLASRLAKPHPDLAQALRDAASSLKARKDPEQRFTVTAGLLATLREAVPGLRGAKHRLAVLDVHVALEDAHFASATAVRERVSKSTRQQRLAWLQASASAIYGTGLMSGREWQALRQSLAQLANDTVPLKTYKAELDYLARVPGWGNQWLNFHFGKTMHRWTAIEPKAALFIQDQLRGSPLFFYAELLDGLLRDANRVAGVQHQLFGEDVGAGLRSLNPGMARGVLMTKDA